MVKITYDIIGDTNFLRDAEYSFHILNFLNAFKDKFELAEIINIQFEEKINSNNKKQTEKDISEDGKTINIIYRISRNNQENGGLSKPNTDNFFKQLKYYIENDLIPEDIKRFKSL